MMETPAKVPWRKKRNFEERTTKADQTASALFLEAHKCDVKLIDSKGGIVLTPVMRMFVANPVEYIQMKFENHDGGTMDWVSKYSGKESAAHRKPRL